MATTGQRKVDAHYYGGTYTRLHAAKASVSLGGVTARRVGLVVATCSTCGAVEVYLGSHHLGRVSTHASRTHYEQVIWLPLTTTRTGTLTIRSASSTTVRVDGVVTLR